MKSIETEKGDCQRLGVGRKGNGELLLKGDGAAVGENGTVLKTGDGDD